MIEVEDFVRTKTGIIDKVQNYSFGCNVWHCEKGMCIDECNCIGTHLEDIVKHSKNIIDLIEVEDYVNGYKIIAINYKENYITIQNINEFGENGIKVLQEDEIETILTKELYEQNCYNVRP